MRFCKDCNLEMNKIEINNRPQIQLYSDGASTCYDCNASLQKVYRDPYKKIKGESYFEWYYKCPQCGKIFYVEEARRTKDQSPQLPMLDLDF